MDSRSLPGASDTNVPVASPRAGPPDPEMTCTPSAALNLVRLLRWLADEPKAQTRCSAFVQLHALAV